MQSDDGTATGRPSEEAARSGFAVDTHCHLFLIEEDAGDVVAAARASGVGRMVCPGIDVPTSARSLELAESFRGVFAAAGNHPHAASGFDREAGSRIEELVGHPMVVAVGETGLDYYRRLSPLEDQRRAFRTHIALSREADKPLIVHVREAWEDAMEILSAEGADRVILHCFSGDETVAAEAVARGYFVSFAGNLTYPSADGLRRAAALIPWAPSGRLLAETDSPFLAPQGRRGTENRPSGVLAVIEELAQLHGTSVSAMTSSTTAAAFDALPLIR